MAGVSVDFFEELTTPTVSFLTELGSLRLDDVSYLLESDLSAGFDKGSLVYVVVVP